MLKNVENKGVTAFKAEAVTERMMKMTEKKHTVVFMMCGIKTTAIWTQAELSKNLTKPDIELISVNATASAGYRRKRRKD